MGEEVEYPQNKTLRNAVIPMSPQNIQKVEHVTRNDGVVSSILTGSSKAYYGLPTGKAEGNEQVF